jgi:quaternary ammonium compound-resistance protein SugE
MAWIALFVAGLFEVGWAIGLKYTEGFTRLWPTVLTVLSMILSLGLLGIALKTLPVGRPTPSGRASARSAPPSSA